MFFMFWNAADPPLLFLLLFLLPVVSSTRRRRRRLFSQLSLHFPVFDDGNPFTSSWAYHHRDDNENIVARAHTLLDIRRLF